MKAHNVQVKVNHYTELHVCAAVEHDMCQTILWSHFLDLFSILKTHLANTSQC